MQLTQTRAGTTTATGIVDIVLCFLDSPPLILISSEDSVIHNPNISAAASMPNCSSQPSITSVSREFVTESLKTQVWKLSY